MHAQYTIIFLIYEYFKLKLSYCILFNYGRIKIQNSDFFLGGGQDRGVSRVIDRVLSGWVQRTNSCQKQPQTLSEAYQPVINKLINTTISELNVVNTPLIRRTRYAVVDVRLWRARELHCSTTMVRPCNKRGAIYDMHEGYMCFATWESIAI